MSPSNLHPLTVPGVGDFVFRRRTLKLQALIEADAIRMTGGPTESKELHRMCVAIVTLRHLTVTAPGDWDVDEVDPLDDEAMGQIFKVFGSLRSAEETFRGGAKPERPPMGPAA